MLIITQSIIAPEWRKAHADGKILQISVQNKSRRNNFGMASREFEFV